MTGSGDYIFSYVNGRPYQAVMYGRNQFVLLMTRSKDLVYPDTMRRVVDEALDGLAPLQKRSPKAEWGVGACYLMLRGVWFDDAHGSVVLYVEQLHDRTIEPVFSEEEIREALFDGGAGQHGQVIIVNVYTTGAYTTSDYFGLYLDEFYEKVREDMHW